METREILKFLYVMKANYTGVIYNPTWDEMKRTKTLYGLCNHIESFSIQDEQHKVAILKELYESLSENLKERFDVGLTAFAGYLYTTARNICYTGSLDSVYNKRQRITKCLIPRLDNINRTIARLEQQIN